MIVVVSVVSAARAARTRCATGATIATQEATKAGGTAVRTSSAAGTAAVAMAATDEVERVRVARHGSSVAGLSARAAICAITAPKAEVGTARQTALGARCALERSAAPLFKIFARRIAGSALRSAIRRIGSCFFTRCDRGQTLFELAASFAQLGRKLRTVRRDLLADAAARARVGDALVAALGQLVAALHQICIVLTELGDRFRSRAEAGRISGGG